MSVQRYFSIALLLAGTVTCFIGLESALRADEEEPYCTISEEISPAVCVPAHQVPPHSSPVEPDTKLGCVNYFYLWCWPDPEIGCWTEGYGVTQAGECFHSFSEEAFGMCFDNYDEQQVVLQYHRSECEFYNANCECIWIIGEQVPHAYWVCDCAVVY